RQLLGRFLANSGLCCLRRNKSVRDKLQRGTSRGGSRESDFRLRTLPRTSAHRIHGRCSARTITIRKRARIRTRAGREGGTRRTKRDRAGQGTRHSRYFYEDRNGAGTFVANRADALGLAFFPTPRLARDHLYLIEQPYGRVFAFETGFPLIDSSRATFT